MTGQAWFTLLLFLAVLAALGVPLGIYMARIANPAPMQTLGPPPNGKYANRGSDAPRESP